MAKVKICGTVTEIEKDGSCKTLAKVYTDAINSDGSVNENEIDDATKQIVAQIEKRGDVEGAILLPFDKNRQQD